MTVVELKKMVIDTTLNDLKHKLHHIIDGIASDKAFDQYNAKCGEADQLREALSKLLSCVDGIHTQAHLERCKIAARAALQPKEGNQ